MGIPSEGMEGQFRNPMSEVIRFFDTKHPNAAKVRIAPTRASILGPGPLIPAAPTTACAGLQSVH
eukprot:COSAG02_NODE_1721_length_11194_cov_7.053718_1_plen_65_part_00